MTFAIKRYHRVLNIPGGSSIFYGKINDGRKSKFVLSFDRNELLTYFFLKKLDNLIGHCAKLTNVQNFTSVGVKFLIPGMTPKFPKGSKVAHFPTNGELNRQLRTARI